MVKLKLWTHTSSAATFRRLRCTQVSFTILLLSIMRSPHSDSRQGVSALFGTLAEQYKRFRLIMDVHSNYLNKQSCESTKYLLIGGSSFTDAAVSVSCKPPCKAALLNMSHVYSNRDRRTWRLKSWCDEQRERFYTRSYGACTYHEYVPNSGYSMLHILEDSVKNTAVYTEIILDSFS